MRNVRGKAWTERALQNSFERAGRRVGVKVTAYQIRGLFASLALRRGVDSLFVSKLLGHKDPSILMKHYAHIEDTQLSEVIEQATNSGAVHPPTTPPSSGKTEDTLPRLARDTALPRDEDPGDTVADPTPKSSARRTH